jgi:hypothetical protein
MTAPARPRRHRKGDRLLAPGATAADIQVDYAVAPFDRAARQADEAWGTDRLPELVSPETAARYGSAIAKLNAAIDSGDAAEVAARAAVCVRGLAALDAEARQRGHTPAPPEMWHFTTDDGKPFVLIRDASLWDAAQAASPGATVHTLREAVIALQVYRSAPLDAARKHFPGAEVVAFRKRTELEVALDDELPF